MATPLEAIVHICHDRGIKVLVDGAHAPAMLRLSLDTLGELGVDWYVGNCHKWLCAPKACGFIVATPEGQRDLHPVVISNFFGEGFAEEFAWTGTNDPSARLAVPAALEFIDTRCGATFNHAKFKITETLAMAVLPGPTKLRRL